MAQQQYSLAFMMKEIMKKDDAQHWQCQGQCDYVRQCDTSVLILIMLLLYNK